MELFDTGSVTTAPQWNVQLRGGFAISTLAGREVMIRTRKAQAVVAILALEEGRPVAREFLASWIWPDSTSEAQKINLRQALAILNRAFFEADPLRPSPIEAERTTVRWASGGHDFGPLTQPLMPGYAEPIFDEFRDLDQSPDSLINPTETLLATLDWSSSVDGGRALEMMRLMPELLSNLPGTAQIRALERTLKLAPANHALRAWAQARHAYAHYSAGNFEEARRLIPLAIEKAQTMGDFSSWQFAVKILTFNQILMGKTKAAVNTAQFLSDHARSETGRLDGMHAAGAAIGYTADFSEAWKRLKLAGERKQDWDIDRDMMGVHRAMFHGESGNWQAAHQELSGVQESTYRNYGVYRVQFDLAKGVALVHEGRIEAARALFFKVDRECQQLEIFPMQTLAFENLAATANSHEERTRFFGKANVLRARTKNPRSRRDVARIQTLETATGNDGDRSILLSIPR